MVFKLHAPILAVTFHSSAFFPLQLVLQCDPIEVLKEMKDSVGFLKIFFSTVWSACGRIKSIQNPWNQRGFSIGFDRFWSKSFLHYLEEQQQGAGTSPVPLGPSSRACASSRTCSRVCIPRAANAFAGHLRKSSCTKQDWTCVTCLDCNLQINSVKCI